MERATNNIKDPKAKAYFEDVVCFVKHKQSSLLLYRVTPDF